RVKLFFLRRNSTWAFCLVTHFVDRAAFIRSFLSHSYFAIHDVICRSIVITSSSLPLRLSAFNIYMYNYLPFTHTWTHMGTHMGTYTDTFMGTEMGTYTGTYTWSHT